MCLRPDKSTTCYITLWKLIDNDLNTNENNVTNKSETYHDNNNDNHSIIFHKKYSIGLLLRI